MRTHPQQTKRRKELEELRSWFDEMGLAHSRARMLSALPEHNSESRMRIRKAVDSFNWPFEDIDSFVRQVLEEKLITHRLPAVINPPLLIVYEELQAKAFATAEYAIRTSNPELFKQVFFVFGFSLLRYEGVITWLESLHSMALIDKQRGELLEELCRAMAWVGRGRTPKKSLSDKEDNKRRADRDRAHANNVQKYYEEAVALYQARKQGHESKDSLRGLVREMIAEKFSREEGRAKKEALGLFLDFFKKDLSGIHN